MSIYSTDQLLSLADSEAQKQGMDPKVVRAILLSENSGFDRGGNLVSRAQVNTDTTSPVGAYGIMQVMPTTKANLARLGYLDPNTDMSTAEGQIRAGVAALKEMKDRGITSPTEQAVAYNGGTASLDAFRGGRTMNAETTTYLKKFTQHLGGTAPMDTIPSATSTSTKEGFSTSKKEIDPTQRAYIDSRLGSANALNADTVTQLQELTKGILSNSSAQSTALDAAAAAKVETINAQAMEKTATQDNTESILNRFGIGLNNPDNIVADRMALIRSNSQERMQLANNIGALESTSPLTDPVGWLMNQVKQYPMIQRHNALVQESNAAAKDIELAQSLAANQERIQPASIKDALNAQRLAAVNETLAGASVEKTKLAGVAKAKVAQLLIDTDQINGSNLAKNIDWAQTTATHIGESFSTTDKNKEENDLLAPINAAAAAWGLPAFNKLTFKTLDKETQDKWVKMSQFGRTGVSPGEAISLLNSTYGNAGLSRINENAPIAGKFLQGIVQNGQTELDSLMARAQADPKIASQLKGLKNPMDQLAYGIDSWAKKKELELKSGDMSKVSSDNPYKLQPAYVATVDALKDNPLAKLIIEKKQSGITIDDNLLLSSALADISSGKRTLGDVAQYVQEFYKTGSDIQRRDSAATLSGWHSLDNYPVIAKAYTLSGKSVDMFSKESIENWLVQQQAASKAANTQGFGETPFGFR